MIPIEIFIIAIIACIVTVVILFILDKKKRGSKSAESKKEKKKKSFSFAKAVKEEPTTENGMLDYNVYTFKWHEYLLIALTAGAVLFVIGFIFYQNVILALLFSFIGFYYPKIRKKKLIKKRKAELSRQFQQALFSLSSSLVAGRSIENAFREVTNDLYLLYPGKETLIIREFEQINKLLENRETIESALEDFSRRAGVEDISNFTDVFVTCKRTGGDLVEVIRRTANMINEKFEIQQEISVMVAQKRFESNALAVAPIGIVALLTYSSKDYMEPMYQWSEFGPIIMTICLGILVFSFWICQRIMDIEV